MAVRFFFEYKNQVIQLPVNPPEFKILSPSNNKTAEIVKLGEVNILRKKKLESFSIECFFPINSSPPYVLTKGKFEPPQFYINFFERVREENNPLRFIITDTNINYLASVEHFDRWQIAGDDDIHYKLELKEYKTYSAKQVTISIEPTEEEPAKITPPVKQEREKAGIAIGDTVIVNGKYWYSSYGDNPFGIFNNFTGKISHIVADANRPYRYHITTTSGGYRGWVAENQIDY